MIKSKIKITTDQRPFIMVYRDFMESQLLDSNEKLLFIALKNFANTDGKCFPSIAKLSKATGISKRVIQRTIKKLEEKGVIKIEIRNREDGGQTSNVYTLYDFRELWQTDNIETITTAVDKYEINRIISILKSKGYTVQKTEKEKELETPTVQSSASSSHTSNKSVTPDMIQNTLNFQKSQEMERYTLKEIKELYNYEYLISDNTVSNIDVETVINILYDTLNTTKKTIRVNGEEKPSMVVIGRLMKLESEEIIWSIDQYHKQTERIRNVESYMLTILYHSKEQFHLDLNNLGHCNGDF